MYIQSIFSLILSDLLFIIVAVGMVPPVFLLHRTAVDGKIP